MLLGGQITTLICHSRNHRKSILMDEVIPVARTNLHKNTPTIENSKNIVNKTISFLLHLQVTNWSMCLT